MLCESALRLGLRPVVYCESRDNSAARATARVHLGRLSDDDRLKGFFGDVDLVIFENEFVDCEKLARLAGPIKFFPRLSVLDRLRDKLYQKVFLQTLGIATSAFITLEEKDDIGEWLCQCRKKLGDEFVVKWTKLGYDGKGVLFSTNANKETTETHCRKARAQGISLFAEKKVQFRRELAMIAVRSIHGEFAHYPLVISEQKDNVCHRIVGPAIELGVSLDTEKEAAHVARVLGDSIAIEGVFAIEFFETDEGILVNEVAPRVHNSGHFTTDFGTSQFENHLRAVLGLPLGLVTASGIFAMANILGPVGGHTGLVPLPIPDADMHLHWYEKKIKPGRKLGHLNGWVRNADELPTLLLRMEKVVSRWQSEFKMRELA